MLLIDVNLNCALLNNVSIICGKNVILIHNKRVGFRDFVYNIIEENRSELQLSRYKCVNIFCSFKF